MKKYKFMTLWTVLLLGLACSVDAVSLWTLINPNTPRLHTKIEWNLSFLDIIRVVNSYLRFIIWLACFIFMIWNGFQLIMSRGNEKGMKNAKTALIWCGIWLASCILAYIIVNIAINLFR